MEEEVLLKIFKNGTAVETIVRINGKDDFEALVIALSAVLARNKALNATVMLAVLERMKHPEEFEGKEAVVNGKLPWED